MTDSNTIDYGPLAGLIGLWQGDKGLDTSPEPDGEERNAYFESIEFTGVGTVTNAEQQTLAAVRYHQEVKRLSNGQVFHDEVGYWMWEAESNTVSHSLTIPRGICVLAGGTPTTSAKGQTILAVTAAEDSADWGIVQSAFMREQARTTAFEHIITLQGDTLSYRETMVLDIYGRRFDHTDSNTLQRGIQPY